MEREEEANSTRAFRLTALLSLSAYVGSDPTLCAGNCIARTSIVPPTFDEKEFFLSVITSQVSQMDREGARTLFAENALQPRIRLLGSHFPTQSTV